MMAMRFIKVMLLGIIFMLCENGTHQRNLQGGLINKLELTSIGVDKREVYASSFKITFSNIPEDINGTVYVIFEGNDKLKLKGNVIEGTERTLSIQGKNMENDILQGGKETTYSISFQYLNENSSITQKLENVAITFKPTVSDPSITFIGLSENECSACNKQFSIIVDSLISNTFSYEIIKLDNKNNDSYSGKIPIENSFEISINDTFATIGDSIILLLYNGDKLIHITPPLQIIEPSQLAFTINRKLFIPSNTVSQYLQVQFENLETILTHCIQTVKLKPQTNKVETIYTFNRSETNLNMYELNTLFKDTIPEKYAISYEILGTEYPSANNFIYIGLFDELFTFNLTPENECAFISEQISLNIENKDLIEEQIIIKAMLFQDNNLLQNGIFTRFDNTYTLSLMNLELLPGNICIKIFDDKDINIDYNFPLKEKCIQVSSFDVFSKEYLYTPSIELILGNVVCELSKPLTLQSTDTVNLNCIFKDKTYSCTNDNVTANEYEIYYDNQKTGRFITVYSNETSSQDNLPFTIEMPSNIIYNEENIIRIKLKDSTDNINDLDTIKEIHVKQNQNLITIYGKENDDNYSEHFKYNIDQKCIELRLKIVPSTNYEISQIIDNYKIYHLNSNEIVFGHYFGIDRKYFFTGVSNQQINLLFNSYSELKDNINNIFYKKGDSTEPYLATCIANSNDITSTVLTCNLPSNNKNLEIIEFGIGEGMISKQTIHIIKVTNTSNLCSSFSSTKLVKTLKIESKEDLSYRCFVHNKLQNGKTNSTLSLDISNIQPGEYPISCSFEDDIIRYEIPDIIVKIVPKFSITDINVDELYYLDNSQEFIIYFDHYLSPNSIEEIRLNNIMIFKPEPFEGLYNYLRFKCNFASHFNGNKDAFKEGTVSIAIKGECGEFESVTPLPKTVKFRYNQIKEIIPTFATSNQQTSIPFTVEFYYSFQEGLIPKTIYLIPQNEGIPQENEVQSFHLKSTYYNNQRKFDLDSSFSSYGIYNISFSYEEKDYSIYSNDSIPSPNINLYLFQYDIEITPNFTDRLVGKEISQVTIPLANPIQLIQIKKITLLTPITYPHEEEITFYDLNKENTEIIIQHPIKLSLTGAYVFSILDYSNVIHTYTINATIVESINNAKIDVIKYSSTMQLENHISFSSTNYDVYRITHILFKEIDTIIDPDGIDAKIITFEKQDLGKSLTQGNEDNKLYIEASSDSSIRVTLKINETEKYYKKFILHSVKESSIGEYVFPEDDNYVIKDYEIENRVVFYNELINKKELNIVIDFIVDSISKQFVNMDETHFTLEHSTNEINSVLCQSIKTKLNCSLTFKKDIIESDILKVKFTDDNTEHEKEIHIIGVFSSNKEQCRLIDEESNEGISFTLKSKKPVPGLKLYINEIAHPEVNLFENFIIDNTNISFNMDLLPSTGSPLIQLGTSNTSLSELIIINLINESIISITGTLTAQVKEDQFITFVFKDLNREITNIYISNNKGNTLTPSTCIQHDDQNNIKCTFNLSSHKNDGDYNIYYTIEQCGEFSPAQLPVKVLKPPINLIGVTPKYMKIDVLQDISIELSFAFTFYQNEQFLKKITLTNIKTNYIHTVYLSETSSTNKIYFSIDNTTSLEKGQYNITLDFISNNNPINVITDKSILIYEHSFVLSSPASTTKWVGDNLNTVTVPIEHPVLSEQISSIKVDSVILKEEEFILNDNNIQIKKEEKLSEPGNREIKIEDITGTRHIFTININDNENLQQAKFEFKYPLPGIENQSNKIIITSHNYRMNQIQEIHFNKEYNGNTINEELIILKDTFIHDASLNSISFSIHLNIKEKFILSKIIDTTNQERNMLNENIILTGYHVVKDFFIISPSSTYVEPQLEFYDYSIAKIKKNSIYFNNLSTPAECSINSNKPEVVICKFYLNSLPNAEKTHPRNFDVSLNTTEGNSITMQLITYETSHNCQELASKIEKVRISLTEQIMNPSNGNFNVYIGTHISYIKSITPIETDLLKTTYEFEIPSSYIINTDLPVKVERSGTSQYELIDDLYVTVIPSGTITKVIMPYLFYTNDKEKDIQVQFDISFHENDIQGLYLTPYSPTNNLNSIKLAQCNFMNAVQNGIIYICNINMQIHNAPGKYYISYINKCGKISAMNDDITITFIDAPNFLMSLTPQSVKLNEIENTVFTATYYNSLDNTNSLTTPYDIVFTNDKGISSGNDIHIDMNSISTDKNKLTFKIKGNDNNYDMGLFNVKSMFMNGYYDISELQVLVYENEIELESYSSVYNLGYELSEIKLHLKYAISTDQIKNITLIPESQPQNKRLLSFGLFIDQVVTTSKLLFINFYPDNLIIDDNYIITIYTNKDYLTKVEYHIKYEGEFNYALKQDVYFINETTENINIRIDVFYPGFITEALNNFYIIKDFISYELSHLTCEPVTDSTTELNCKYTLPSDLEKGMEITIQYKQDNLSTRQKSIYLVQYNLNNKLLNEIESNKLSTTNYISFTSPIELSFYFNENESQIPYTFKIYNSKKQYSISYSNLQSMLTHEGLFTLYAVKPSEKPINYIPIDNIVYIHLSNKQIINTPSLKASYIDDQILSLEFNTNILDNEIQSVQIKDQAPSQNILATSKSCSKVNGLNNVLCIMNLKDVSNVGEFDLEYSSLNGRVMTLGKINIENELAIMKIEPEIYELTSSEPIIIKLSKNIDQTVYDTISIELQPMNDDSGNFIPSTNQIQNLNEISFSLDKGNLIDDNYDDLYEVVVTLSNQSKSNLITIKTQILLYSSSSVVFSFNRKILSLNSNTEEIINLILTSNIYTYTINNVYRKDTNEQLKKEEFVNEDAKQEYRFIYALNGHDILAQMEKESKDQMEIFFEFETPFSQQYRIPIAQGVTIIKSIDNLISVTGMGECNYYKEKHSITIKTTDTDAYVIGQLDPYLAQIQDGEINLQSMYQFKPQVQTTSNEKGFVYELEELSEEQISNLIGNEYTVIIYETEGNNLQTYASSEEKVILYQQPGIHFTKLTIPSTIYEDQTQLTFNDVTCDPSFLFDLDIYSTATNDNTPSSRIHFSPFTYDKDSSTIIAEFKNTDIKDLDQSYEYFAKLTTGTYVNTIKISPTIENAKFLATYTINKHFPLSNKENVLVGLSSDYYMSKVNKITTVNNENHKESTYSLNPSQGEEQFYFDKDNNYILLPSLSLTQSHKVIAITESSGKTISSNLLINDNLQMNEYFIVDKNIFYISQKSTITVELSPSQNHHININALSLHVNGKIEKCTQQSSSKTTCTFTVEPTPTIVTIQYNINNIIINTPIIIMTYTPFEQTCTVIDYSAISYETINITMPRFAYNEYIGNIGLKIGMKDLEVKEDVDSNADYISTYSNVRSDLFRESGTNKVSVIYSDTNTVVLEELKVDSIKKVDIKNVSGYLYSGKDNQVLIINLENDILEMDKPHVFNLVNERESNRKVITNNNAVLTMNNIIECTFDIPKGYDGLYSLKYIDLCGNEFSYRKSIAITEASGDIEDNNKEDNDTPPTEDNNEDNENPDINDSEIDTTSANDLFKVPTSYINLNNKKHINGINNIVDKINNGKDIDDIFTSKTRNNIVPITLNTLSSFPSNQESTPDTHKTILYLVGLAIQEQSSKLKLIKLQRISHTNNTRILDTSSESSFISNINTVLSSLKSYFEQTKTVCGNENLYEVEQDPFYYIHIHKWTNKQQSINSYINNCFPNKTSSYIDITTIPELYTNTSNTICFFSIELSPFLNNLLLKLDNDISSSKVIFSSYYTHQPSNSKTSSLISAKTLLPSNQTFIYLYIPIVNNSINVDLYKQYSNYGINIYNAYDNAFNNPCYVSPLKLDYDLTQEYRYKYIYQQEMILPGNESTCMFEGIDYDYEKVVLKCLFDSVNEGDYYTVMPKELESYDVKKLPLKCIGKIENIGKNAAFWIFFLVLLFLIGINGLIILCEYKNIFGNMKLRGLINDGIDTSNAKNSFAQNKSSVLNIQDHSQVINNHNMISQLNKKNSNLNDQEIKIEVGSVKTGNSSVIRSKLSSVSTFIKSLKHIITIHPILSLTPFNHSITSPMMINAHISVFSFLSLFFLSSLYLTENIIEKRIYESLSKRNNFAYPIRNHFGIIIAVILTSMVFTFILRVLSFITISQKKTLSDDISKSTTEIEQCSKVNNFNSNKLTLIRRFSMCILCWGLILLYTIYCIGYAGIYRNSQCIWIYTSIWSVLFHWFVFSPIYIIIVNIFRVKEKEDICYYLTKLSII